MRSSHYTLHNCQIAKTAGKLLIQSCEFSPELVSPQPTGTEPCWYRSLQSAVKLDTPSRAQARLVAGLTSLTQRLGRTERREGEQKPLPPLAELGRGTLLVSICWLESHYQPRHTLVEYQVSGTDTPSAPREVLIHPIPFNSEDTHPYPPGSFQPGHLAQPSAKHIHTALAPLHMNFCHSLLPTSLVGRKSPKKENFHKALWCTDVSGMLQSQNKKSVYTEIPYGALSYRKTIFKFQTA